MGASNVKAVFQSWAHLDHREIRGLLYMANTAKDQDQPPVYWEGWEKLALALGHQPSGKPESARRSAMRVLSSLCRAGAIVSSGQAKPGVRAEYALTLDREFTFQPQGAGRNITWQRVPRNSAPVTPPVTPPVTAEVPLPVTAAVRGCDSQGPEPVTATATPRNNTQEQHQEDIEEEVVGLVPKSPKRTSTKAATDALFAPDRSLQEEKERQFALLQQRQADYEQNQRKTA